MSEKQTDVEHALSAFGAPAIPYQQFDNGIVAAPNEILTRTDHRSDTAFPLLAASLPELSSLTLAPASSRSDEGSGDPIASAASGARSQAAGPGLGRSFDGLVSCSDPIAASGGGRGARPASRSAACEFECPTALRRPLDEAARRASRYGQLPIAELFKILGAPPALNAATRPPAGDLRQVFRMLDRTD